MNFFEHQDNAKKQTRWLVIAFIAAVVGIVLAMDLLIYALSQSQSASFADMKPALAFSTIGTVGLITITSLYRTMSLRSGGGKVAQEMGGVPVGADERDPLRRRLRNVVEEIALASGVPVPDIYVLEKESGINAFAAGFTPSSAAVAVTRGTLEKLNREELQGVLAHEFSHILNGDMRLNIRLIGLLFGISVIALIGRQILYSGRRSQIYRSRSSDDNGMGLIAIGLAVTIIGSIGLFFARAIKAGVSRKREYLADASAVQFTRNPDGISGALKRIAIDSVGVKLNADTEEVNHMMFGSKSLSGVFATHPPLMERIKRVQPSFQESELDDLRNKVKRKAEKIARSAEDEMTQESNKGRHAANLDFTNIIEQIGNPGQNQLFLAALISASISEDLHSAARSTEWAREVVCLLLLSDDDEIRNKQKLIITKQLGAHSLQQLEHLEKLGRSLKKEHRLPLAEIAFPALKRRPPEDIEILKATIGELIRIDGKVEVFEYALARMLQQFLSESINPSSVKIHGKKELSSLQEEVCQLLAVVAGLGHADGAQADMAYSAGIEALQIEHRKHPTGNWKKALDTSLQQLDELRAGEKERLIRAIITTVAHDHEVTLEEAEILRAICSRLHVPLPVIAAKNESVSR